MKIDAGQREFLSAIGSVSRVIAALVASLLLAVICVSGLFASSSPETAYLVQVNAPEADVARAVQEVTEDQIIHGTYSFEKERTLYGAHAANAAPVFGKWDQPGKVFYKIADKILSPRFFKDSEDIGTISIRYVIQPIEAGTTSLRIDAVFVDARNVKHASKGSVEAAEYGAIQQHIQTIQAEQKETDQAAQQIKEERERAPGQHQQAANDVTKLDDNWSVGLTIPQLESRVSELRHEAELQTRESGASLKAAPFRTSTTLASLPGKTEVAVEVLTPYWYGVETSDGRRGWIHRGELEPVE